MVDRTLFNQISTPCAFIDWDAFVENVEAVANKSNGKKIRIATKSIRSVQVLKYLLNSDECFKGLMCYSPQEAAYLAGLDFDDLLIGYPTIDKEAIDEIAPFIKNGKKIVFMIDHIEQLNLLEEIGAHHEVTFPVCIDIDMSSNIYGIHFGVRRSPLKNSRDVAPILTHILKCLNVKLVGLMGYEAQIAGIGDQVKDRKLFNKVIQFLKYKSLKEITKRRRDIVKFIEMEGFQLEFVNGGGTGSLHTTAKEKVVTEVTIGSGFYAPTLFDDYRNFQFKPAIGFALPIIRKPAENIYTCTSGGFIASGSVGKEKQPSPFSPKNCMLLSAEGAGEVQTPIYFNGNEELNIGDHVLFRPSKAGEIAERFSHIYIISDNKIIDQYTTYRGDKRCFL